MKRNEEKLERAKKVAWRKIIIGLIFLLSLISVLLDDISIGKTPGEIMIDFVMMVIIILIILNGFKQKGAVSKVNKYSSIAASYNSHNRIPLLKFSELTRVPENKIIKDINYLVDKEYISGIYYDYNTKELVLTETKNVDRVKSEKVICNSCGGVNEVIKGKSKECDYCGSVIKG